MLPYVTASFWQGTAKWSQDVVDGGLWVGVRDCSAESFLAIVSATGDIEVKVKVETTHA